MTWWAATTLHTTPASRDITNATTATWGVSAVAALVGGESVVSATVTLVQVDPPTLATVPGFAGSASINANVATFSVNGAVLIEGQTYRMETAFVLNTSKVLVLLTHVMCVA
jgi:hypothetical protein